MVNETSRKGMQHPCVDIDNDSGFCFGVVNAIQKAEQELATSHHLYCLGDIVHNSDEVERLSKAGLQVIEHKDLAMLCNTKLLFRAHGEPPKVYEQARSNGVEIIDATCPVVLALQKRILKAWTENPNAQIVIYGKKGHAEVNGLVGQTQGEAIVVEHEDEIENIDFSKPIYLFSQTTKSIEGFKKLVEEIKSRMVEGVDFVYYDTICRQVANRMDNIKKFAREHDLVFFVSGKKNRVRFLTQWMVPILRVRESFLLIANANARSAAATSIAVSIFVPSSARKFFSSYSATRVMAFIVFEKPAKTFIPHCASVL